MPLLLGYKVMFLFPGELAARLFYLSWQTDKSKDNLFINI
jgi:hypothetical protein